MPRFKFFAGTSIAVCTLAAIVIGTIQLNTPTSSHPEIEDSINPAIDMPVRDIEYVTQDEMVVEDVEIEDSLDIEQSDDAIEHPNESYSNYMSNTYSNPYSNTYKGYSNYDGDFKSAGVVYGEDGTRYTWYSQKVLPGGGLTDLNNNGRHVNDSGYICDGDGYLAVSSSDHAQGEIIETPFGTAKVYDTGCASGTIDVYTDF